MKKLAILFLANSFADDTIQYMNEIARDFDYELDLYNLYIGGCDIEKHINNIVNHLKVYELRVYNREKCEWETIYDIASNDFIPSKKWDYIVLQQSSYYSGLPNGFKDINKLVELVRKLANKDVKFVWNLTWAYPKYSDLEVFTDYFKSNQDKMYEAILDNFRKEILHNKNFSLVIPNGISLQIARKRVGDEMLHRDGFHLSYQPGRYLAGLTACAVLLNVDISKTKFYPQPITKEIKDVFVECVQDALKVFKTKFN